MPFRRLNLDEAATYLHLSRADLDALVLRREVPCERMGDRVVFIRSELDSWASRRILGLTEKTLDSFHQRSTAAVQHKTSTRDPNIIATLLRPSCCDAFLTSRTKASILRDMVKLAERTELVYSAEELLTSLREREDMCSTALTGDVALLHPRHHDPYMFEDSFIILSRLQHPIPFGAPDGQNTSLFFLICCQDDAIHLHVLARLCKMLSQPGFTQTLLDTESTSDMVDAVLAAELDVLRRMPGQETPPPSKRR